MSGYLHRMVERWVYWIMFVHPIPISSIHIAKRWEESKCPSVGEEINSTESVYCSEILFIFKRTGNSDTYQHLRISR